MKRKQIIYTLSYIVSFALFTLLYFTLLEGQMFLALTFSWVFILSADRIAYWVTNK